MLLPLTVWRGQTPNAPPVAVVGSGQLRMVETPQRLTLFHLGQDTWFWLPTQGIYAMRAREFVGHAVELVVRRMGVV